MWASWQQVYWNPWGWTLVILGIAFAFSIPWKVRLMPWTVSYILLTSVGYSYQSANYSVAPATMSGLLAVLCFLVFCKLPEPKIGYRRLLMIGGIVGVIASLAAPFCYKDRIDARWLMPLFWNRSMGGVFTVLALAGTPLFFLGGISALVLQRTTPMLVYVTCFIWQCSSLLRLFVCTVIGAAYFYACGLPSSTGRMEFWTLYWNNFTSQPLSIMLFGSHLGTTSFLLPAAQYAHGMSTGDQYYIWLHNDLFQALTEFGVTGFTLCVLTGISIWRLCNRGQRAIGLALCVSMLADMPWHWIPQCLLFWVWIKTNGVQDTVRMKSSTPTWLAMNFPKVSRLLVSIS